MKYQSMRRLAENEVIFREANKDIQEFLEMTRRPRQVVSFYCECSHPDCRGRIDLTPEEYARLHENKLQFVLLPNHEIPSIERIVKVQPGFNVVEKFGELPGEDDISEAISDIQL